MRVLITGVSGFAGRWLACELAGYSRYELFGMSRHRPAVGANGRSPLPKRLRFFTCDLNDKKKLIRIMSQIKPDRIHHLAGQASVSYSWKHPGQTRKENVEATKNLLVAVQALPHKPLVHLAGSAEVYGRQKRLKIRETDALRPRNPYARTKKEQEALVLRYAKKSGAPVVITRAFNHAGPGQREQFALSNFARQIACIEAGLAPAVLHVGNLTAVRDFTDVRDVVRAYRMAAETGGGVRVYNVATGRGRSLADRVAKLAALSRVPLRIVRDPARVRREDLPRLVGDPSKIRRETGWKARVSAEQTLLDILNDWRRAIRKRKQ